MNRKSGAARSPSTQGFTDKQSQYLAFIYTYEHMFRRPPAEADMQRHFQVTPPSVHQMIVTLERNGLISRQATGDGAIRQRATDAADRRRLRAYPRKVRKKPRLDARPMLSSHFCGTVVQSSCCRPPRHPQEPRSGVATPISAHRSVPTDKSGETCFPNPVQALVEMEVEAAVIERIVLRKCGPRGISSAAGVRPPT